MKPRALLPTRPILLSTAMVACALVWVAIVVMSVTVLQSQQLLALSVSGVLLTVTLITLVRLQQRRLQGLAATDGLTGLLNHGAFHQALARELAKAKRSKAPCALVCLDLDDFKAVNDTHGHPYGDAVLQRIGRQLRTSIRGGDEAARIGGEEFALLLPNTGGEIAYAVAERARAAVARVSPHDTRVTCSVGIAVYPSDAEDALSLIQLADAALYAAKRAGKARTRRFDFEQVSFNSNERQAAEIERILTEESMIESVFQPVVELTTGRLLGYEALARFPDSRERPPAAWFAQAHACGLGPELEAAAIRAALRPGGREAGTHLAINISPSALSSEPIAEALPTDLTDIVIELTEHEAFVGDDLLNTALQNLRARGARIALDDAGAGYAGLKHLVWVRPDIVKLDRELIRAIHSDTARLALVESFVRFARRVGATVCAEGIETLEDLAALANLDVPWGQGFALARPAAPWAQISPSVPEVCRAALEQALQSTPGGETQAILAGDRRLEHLSACLAAAGTRDDLYGVLGLIGAELHADKVCLSQFNREADELETLAESGQQAGEEYFALADYPLSAKSIHEQEAVQVLVSDPDADPSEVELLMTLDYGSLLLVPVVHRGKTLGAIEAFCAAERPWTRTEINRARIISNQFASVIKSLNRGQAAPVEGRFHPLDG